MLKNTDRKLHVPDRHQHHLECCREEWEAIGRRDPLKTMYPSYITVLGRILKANGWRLIWALQGDINAIRNYVLNMDQERRDCMFDAIGRVLLEDNWKDFLNLDIIDSLDTYFAAIGRQFVKSELARTGWIATGKSWYEPYRGDAPERLWKHIMGYYKQYDGHVSYANICAVVQSSGMGKSRMVDELGKSHFVIPLCVRTGNLGYPPPDEVVRDFLTSPRTFQGARHRCSSLLISLFRHTLCELKGALESDSALTKQQLISWFYNKIALPENSQFRRRFLDSALSMARTVEQDSDDLRASTEELANFLRAMDSTDCTGEVQIVVAIDEAHVLANRKGFYDDAGPSSVLTAFRDTFHNLSGYPVWALFVSTSASVVQFSSEAASANRNAVISEVPPFTNVGYDTFASQVKISQDSLMLSTPVERPTPQEHSPPIPLDGTVTLNLVTDAKFMATFGRPLFTLRDNYGDSFVRDNLMEFVMQKLICNELPVFCPTEESGMPAELSLALLSQRIGLEVVSPVCNYAAERQIEKYMRLCLEIAPDKQHIGSSPGSEPLLAEGAATIMMLGSVRPATMLNQVLDKFKIKREARNDVATMLAVTIARDSAARENMESIHPRLHECMLHEGMHTLSRDVQSEYHIFRAVGVDDFMKKLFKLDDPQLLKDLATDFQDSHLHFNHFIKSKTDLTFTLPFLMLYMVRGAALFCANYVPGIDFVLPILAGNTFCPDHMSAVLVRSSRGSESSKDVFGRMDQAVIKLFKNAPLKRPVIRIVFSLEWHSDFEYKQSSFSEDGELYITHDFRCRGHGKHFLPGKCESNIVWGRLVASTIFSGDDDGKDTYELPTTLRPGEYSNPEFWPWVHGL